MEGYVVGDAYGEVSALCSAHISEDCVYHRGVKLLAADAVSAADNLLAYAELAKRGNYVEIQRLALCARLLGSVHNGDCLDGGGDCVDKRFGGEGTVKSYLYHTYLLSSCVEIVNRFLDSLCAAAHNHYDAVCVLCSVIVDEIVLSARERADLVHLRLHDCGYCVVILV